jgi:hypothetical protein
MRGEGCSRCLLLTGLSCGLAWVKHGMIAALLPAHSCRGDRSQHGDRRSAVGVAHHGRAMLIHESRARSGYPDMCITSPSPYVRGSAGSRAARTSPLEGGAQVARPLLAKLLASSPCHRTWPRPLAVLVRAHRALRGYLDLGDWDQ